MSRAFKRIKYYALAVVFVVASFFTTATTHAQESGGDGTAGSPYVIRTCDDLQNINNDLHAHYMLANDIDCTGHAPTTDGNFLAIGGAGADFSGTLDGNNYTISNIVATYFDGAGIFSGADGATFSNITLDSISLGSIAGQNAGSLVGHAANTSFNNIIVRNSALRGQESIGGLVGTIYESTVTNSSVENTDVEGIQAQGHSYDIGGLVGYAESSQITGSSASGTVTGNSFRQFSSQNVGGLVGSTIDTVIENSYSTASVSGGSYVGGLVGASGGSISNSYARGDVTGHPIVDVNDDGTLAGADYVIGGLVGYGGMIISNSFSTGAVRIDNNILGGLAGNSSALFVNDYFDETSSGTNECVSGSGVIAGCTGINTNGTEPNYFYDIANAPFDTWDFNSTWRAVSGGYPTHASVPLAPTDINVVVSTDSLVLHWTADSSGDIPLTGYTIRYGLTGSQDITEISNIDPTALSAALDDLTPATSYDIQLRATNARGDGKWTDFTISTAAVILDQNTSASGVTSASATGSTVSVVTAKPVYPRTYASIPVPQTEAPETTTGTVHMTTQPATMYRPAHHATVIHNLKNIVASWTTRSKSLNILLLFAALATGVWCVHRIRRRFK